MLEKILFLPQCQSTNDVAWNALDEGRAGHGTLLYAGEQTAGRGQRGTSWQSRPGENLLCSTLLFTSGLVQPEAAFDLSRAIALAAAEAMEALTGGQARPDLKWPNDLYLDGKKLGGILIENRWTGQGLEWCVAGIGINLNQLVFEPGLAATSLALATGNRYLVEEAAVVLQSKLEVCLSALAEPGRLRTGYEERLLGLGRLISLVEPDGVPFYGQILGTTVDGRLRVLIDGFERLYDVKEVRQLIA